MMLVLGKSGKSAVGLDIGSHSIKVVELVRSGKSLKMARYAIQELAPGTVVDGEVVNREHLISTITDVLRNAGIKSKSVYSAVSGRSVIVRRIPMEKMTEAQARQAIHWEAEQHIPFRIDEVSLDFKIINEEIAPGQMEVLLVAAKKEVVDLHRGLLQSAGLRPEAIELEQFALQRAYEHAYQPGEEECVTILNVGAEVTNMIVIKGGLPSFNRDLAIGGNRFIEALQRSLGLDYEAAETVLKGNLPEGTSSEDVRSAISHVIEELSTSVRRSFISFQASGESTRIDRMYISGGCSLMPGLATILSEQHGLPVEPFQPFRNITVDASVLPDDDRAGVDAILAVCTGLALRGYVPGMVDINILGAAEQKKKKKRPAGESNPLITLVSFLPLILVAGGILLMVLNYGQLKQEERDLQSQISDIDAQIAQMEAQVAQQEQADLLELQVDSKRNDIINLALKQKYTVYVMEYLCRALYPEQTAFAEETEKGIYLSNLTLYGPSLHLTGVARTWGDIVSFQRRLVELRPDGISTLFSLPEFGQTYTLTTEGGDLSGAETRYQFDLEIGVDPTSLSPLVGDYAGI